MATLRNRRKLVAVSRETPKNIRNSHSQNTRDPGMAQEYISQVSEEIEERVTKKLSKHFSRTEARILTALSKHDEFLLNPQVRTCSVAVPGTSRNNNSENREPTGDRSLGDHCPEAVISACHSSNINYSEQDETHHTSFCQKSPVCGFLNFLRQHSLRVFILCIFQYSVNIPLEIFDSFFLKKIFTLAITRPDEVAVQTFGHSKTRTHNSRKIN